MIGGDAPARIAGGTVWELLGKVQGHAHQEDNARVGDAMRRFGFVRTKVRTGLPNPVNGYQRGKGGGLFVVKREGDFGTITGVEVRSWWKTVPPPPPTFTGTCGTLPGNPAFGRCWGGLL